MLDILGRDLGVSIPQARLLGREHGPVVPHHVQIAVVERLRDLHLRRLPNEEAQERGDGNCLLRVPGAAPKQGKAMQSRAKPSQTELSQAKPSKAKQSKAQQSKAKQS